MASYNWRSGLTYQQHLQNEAYLRDVTGEIRKSGQENRLVLSEQTRQLTASNEALARAFGDRFDQVNGTLQEGFGQVGEGIAALGAAFEWGMSLLIQRMDEQNRLLDGILQRLEAIHHTLQTPTLTQAREFYNIGRDRLRKGLLDKALESFLQAEAKNDTDFLTQYSLGHLYLYGVNEDSSTLNLPKAEQHFRNAARYAKPEIQQVPDAQRYCGEAYFHASVACYLQACASRDAPTARRLWEESRKLADTAQRVYPQLSEALFQQAKSAALLGDAPAALHSLTLAFKADRNFDSLRPQIFKVIEGLREEAKKQAQGHQPC